MSSPEFSIEYRFSVFRVDVRQRRLLTANDKLVSLSSRAFDTLLALLEHQGETLSKAQLMARVWPHAVVEENNLNQAISSLRKALGESRSENRFIATIPGRGYCFVAAVERVDIAPADPPPEVDDMVAGTAPAATSVPLAAPPPPHAHSRWLMPTLLLGVAIAAGILLALLYDFSRSGSATGMIEQADTQQRSSLRPDTPIRNSIAVLPFTNMDPDADNQLFALGLHDEIINQLTKISSLNVISRSSVVPLASQQLPVQELARMLRVESVMSGTIMFIDEQARVSLQLLNPLTGLSLWAGTYEANTRNLSDMIAVQSDIAFNVARTLEAEILQSERERIASIPTTSFAAYRYNLAARNAHFRQDFAQEWSLAQQAIALDPLYYDAYLTLSSVNTVLVATPLPGMSSRDHYELALSSANRLIELDPNNNIGYALKAVALATNKEWEEAAALIDQLDALGAPLSDQHYIALLLMCFGDFERAIAIYDANLLTEPLNFFGRGFQMVALELAGNRERSRQEYALGEELNPQWWGDTVNIFLALGRGEPLRDIDDIVGISPELKTLLANYHDRERVYTGLRAFASNGRKVSAEAVFYAALAAEVGDHELAVEFMRSSLQDVWTSLYWFWLPVFNDTRQLASFRQLLRDAGMVAFWERHGWPEICQPQGNDFSCEWQAYPQR